MRNFLLDLQASRAVFIVAMLFWRGFRDMMPLWAGVIPFALAYAVSARAAGLSLIDTQLMSLIVFAGSSQFSAASLFALDASTFSLVLTTFVINVRHLLYTLTLGQKMNLTWQQKLVAAHITTDEAFGITIAKEDYQFTYYMGIALSLFISWNCATLIGSLVSSAIPDPVALGIDFIFPVAFIALLIPLLKNRVDISIALLSGLIAYVLSQVLSSGLVILFTGILGALVGAIWKTRQAKT